MKTKSFAPRKEYHLNHKENMQKGLLNKYHPGIKYRSGKKYKLRKIKYLLGAHYMPFCSGHEG